MIVLGWRTTCRSRGLKWATQDPHVYQKLSGKKFCPSRWTMSTLTCFLCRLPFYFKNIYIIPEDPYTCHNNQFYILSCCACCCFWPWHKRKHYRDLGWFIHLWWIVYHHSLSLLIHLWWPIVETSEIIYLGIPGAHV